MKKVIRASITNVSAAADDTVDNRLADAISVAKEDFDYIVMGLEHMGRQGANATSEALRIIENLQNGIKGVLGEIADNTDGSNSTSAE